MSDTQTDTLIFCLREVAKMLPRGTELDAFIQGCDLNSKDSMEIGVELAAKLRLSPEKRNDANADELASYFGAPVLLRLKNGNWVLFLGLRTQTNDGKQEERFAVYDPLGKTQGKMLLLSREQLNSAWEGDAIFIKIELAGCSVDGRHTSLYCLTAVVKHYEIGRAHV